MYVCMYVCMYICIYIHIYIYNSPDRVASKPTLPPKG